MLKVFRNAFLYFREDVNFATSQVLFGIRVLKSVWFASTKFIQMLNSNHNTITRVKGWPYRCSYLDLGTRWK
jgi:hypothetical protein